MGRTKERTHVSRREDVDLARENTKKLLPSQVFLEVLTVDSG
jgi:hypothetical protein